ncbi:MAG: hypothetical protein GY716_18590 [bacterium]|nr:hypothetical protein [bacterium]
MTARLVYSSGDGGDRRGSGAGDRGEPRTVCPPGEHAVRVRRERSGRKGKTVTLVGPLFLTRHEATKMTKELKRRCGSGGKLGVAAGRDGRAVFEIELQGDHVETMLIELERRGFPAKQSGG